MYFGSILDSQHLITLPTDPEELASLLDTCALDWGTCLLFLNSVATRQGIYLELDKIREIMVRSYQDLEKA